MRWKYESFRFLLIFQPHERVLIQLMCVEGARVKTIEWKLGIKHGTCCQYLVNIYKKAHVSGGRELTIWYWKRRFKEERS